MNKRPATFVASIDTALAPKIIKDLKDQDFEISQPEHTLFCAKKTGVSCTLFATGKLVVQGRAKDEFIEFYLEPAVLKTFDYAYSGQKIDHTPHIGIDESGKGDFFGPLCVAGVYADAEGVDKLLHLGVKDSKNLSDAQIFTIAKSIRESVPFHLVKINPLKYNELYKQFGNLNHLLAWGHATAIEELALKTKCSRIIIDQFADERVVEKALERKGLHVDLHQRHKAESDPVVAAASILARYRFLSGLKSLGNEFGMHLPKGASGKTIEAGKVFVATFGIQELPRVGKMHFKTLDSITNRGL